MPVIIQISQCPSLDPVRGNEDPVLLGQLAILVIFCIIVTHIEDLQIVLCILFGSLIFL